MWLTLKILDFILCLFNIFLIKKFLHLYQLKDYNNRRYLSHILKHNLIFFFINIILFFTTNLCSNTTIKICSITLSLIASIVFYYSFLTNKKTPLVYTNKIKRLYFICTLSAIFFTFLPKILSFSQIFIVFSPILANFLNFYDKLKNFYYIKKAQVKLKNSRTKIIAITGSNGKTSVKNILLSILSTQYKVQATPSSYNTPLGISKFINNNLENDCNFVILEYGARRKNDIKKLCKIFGADYGILTTISLQHLQTFKTVENIAKAKSELPNFLKNQLCIFNYDNKFCKQIYNNKIGKKLSVSISKKTDIFASKILVKNFITNFRLHTPTFCANISTSLLGEHNVLNILLCCALAIKLNIKTENLINAITTLKPTPHRLEYIKSNINILDDSYNCSLSSAKQAIQVLNSTDYKKMVVTPGIIEGGKNQFELNYKLGKMLTNLDYVVIVGQTNKKAILSGIKSQNFKCKIITCSSLEESKQYFKLLLPNDCLLLLNDLPDDYN